MLQRIQTVFMLIAVISMVALLFLPLWEKTDQDVSDNERELITMKAFEMEYEKTAVGQPDKPLNQQRSFLPIGIGAILAAVVMLFSITRFKNRMLQIKLNALFSLLTAITLCGIVYYALKATAMFEPKIPGNYLLGFFLPVVAMFNNIIANRFIRRDEKLVRDSDRLR